MSDHPINECAATLDAMISRLEAEGREMRFYQKWTCAHCGARQTMAEADSLFLSGICEECGKLTESITHCNYMLIMGAGPSAAEIETPDGFRLR